MMYNRGEYMIYKIKKNILNIFKISNVSVLITQFITQKFHF